MKLFAYVSKKTAVLYVLTTATFVGTLCLLPVLPKMIVMTLRPTGEQKSVFLLLLTALLPGLATILFSCVPYEDEQGEARQRPFYYQSLMWLFALALGVYHWLVIVNALGFSITGEVVAQLGLALMMLTIGIYLRQLPFGHPGVAIKLSWVMENADVWRKTHRWGGFAFILVGLVTMVSIVLVHLPYWAVSPSIPTIVLIASLLLASVAIMLGSMRCYKKTHSGTEDVPNTRR